MTKDEMLDQFSFAVQRAEHTCQAMGEKVTTDEDAYAGLMWFEDANTLRDARTFILDQKKLGPNVMTDSIHDAAFVLYLCSAFFAGALAGVLLFKVMS